MINPNIIIPPTKTLFQSLEIMDQLERKLLIVCDSSMRFYGVISVGDIQRAILDKKDLSAAVLSFIREDILYARQEDSVEEIKACMKRERIESMPVVSNRGLLIDIIDWTDIFENGEEIQKENVSLPVVVMAGGKGTRLRPLTNIIPKPLIPISSKTIIEEIIERFEDVGCYDFYISVNYKAQLIKDYFSNRRLDCGIQYIEEKEPLGTAGSLYLLEGKLNETFFVTNCDILVDVDLTELVKYHKNNKNLVTLVSVLKNYSIPYGTIETKENGVLVGLKEKPDHIYQINSGLYVLEPKIFSFIQHGEFIHLPDLIQRISDGGGRIGVFPIPEGCWTDMGNWNEYLRLVNSKKE